MQVLNYVVEQAAYKPLEHKHGLWFVQWNAEPLEGEETAVICRSCALPFCPTVEQIRAIVENDINADTDEKILNGYEWNGTPVYLSSENQFNYKAAYDLAVQTAGASLPVTFKLSGTNYRTFETLDDLQSFYTGAINHIQRCLLEGWEKKDSIDYSVYADNDVAETEATESKG